MAEGQDETRAREVLAAMQDRVARGPHAALGISIHATSSDVRTAFLALTKIYHPARFGRMAIDIQRLSNEVFLGIRGAHDSLAKPKGRPTGPILPSTTPTAPLARVPATPSRGTSPNPRVQMPPAPVKAPTGPPPTLAKPPTGPQPTKQPTGQLPVVRSTSDPVAPRRTPTASPPPERRPTPPTGIRTVTGASQPAPNATRSSSSMPVVDREVTPIYELMIKNQWGLAKTAIGALLSRAPNTPKYQALMSYARGREAQLAGSRDEARVELDTALQLDPDLQIAKTALGELFTRRK
ncbi:MAG: hypothetical protein ABI867_38100 [Kofleriaceae bacterium]